MFTAFIYLLVGGAGNALTSQHLGRKNNRKEISYGKGQMRISVLKLKC